MVFQNYALFPHLTVADNIGFPLKQRGVDRATRTRLLPSLDLVRLPGYQARYPPSFPVASSARRAGPFDRVPPAPAADG
jgi:ABC-type Fe3+/spermidine/putrescine transport system ATPase subunit